MINNLFYFNFVKYINNNKCIPIVYGPSCLGLVCEEERCFISIIYIYIYYKKIIIKILLIIWARHEF